MTNEEKKRWLCRYRTADGRIDDLIREREKAYGIITKITPSYSAGRGSSGDDKMTNGVIKLVELDEQINAEIDRLVDLRNEIDAVLHTLNNDKLYRVMYLRYILGMSWERIAMEMRYDVRQIYRYHGQALFLLKI